MAREGGSFDQPASSSSSPQNPPKYIPPSTQVKSNIQIIPDNSAQFIIHNTAIILTINIRPYNTKYTATYPTQRTHIQATVSNPRSPTAGIIGSRTVAALVTVGVEEELLPLAEEEPIELEPVLEPEPEPELEPGPELDADAEAEGMLPD